MDVDADADELPAAPPIFSHLTVGINEVTKRLESQANSCRVRSSIRAPSIPEAAEEAAPAPKAERPSLTHVFVCRADVDPPLLIAHLPELVAACNIPSPTPSQRHTPIQLIPLPKHAEYTLTEVIGLRRVSVLAFDVRSPAHAEFLISHESSPTYPVRNTITRRTLIPLLFRPASQCPVAHCARTLAPPPPRPNPYQAAAHDRTPRHTDGQAHTYRGASGG